MLINKPVLYILLATSATVSQNDFGEFPVHGRNARKEQLAEVMLGKYDNADGADCRTAE